MEKEEKAINYLDLLAERRKEMMPVVAGLRERLVAVLGRLPEFVEAVTKSFLEGEQMDGDKRVGFGLDEYWYEVDISEKGERLSIFRCGIGEVDKVGALSSGFSLNNTGEMFYLEVIGGEWVPGRKEWDREAVPWVEAMIGEMENSLQGDFL